MPICQCLHSTAHLHLDAPLLCPRVQPQCTPAGLRRRSESLTPLTLTHSKSRDRITVVLHNSPAYTAPYRSCHQSNSIPGRTRRTLQKMWMPMGSTIPVGKHNSWEWPNPLCKTYQRRTSSTRPCRPCKQCRAHMHKPPAFHFHTCTHQGIHSCLPRPGNSRRMRCRRQQWHQGRTSSPPLRCTYRCSQLIRAKEQSRIDLRGMQQRGRRLRRSTNQLDTLNSLWYLVSATSNQWGSNDRSGTRKVHHTRQWVTHTELHTRPRGKARAGMNRPNSSSLAGTASMPVLRQMMQDSSHPLRTRMERDALVHPHTSCPRRTQGTWQSCRRTQLY